MRSRSAVDRLRILVLGYIVRGPIGGLVWHHLQYVMGLARLGHDVYFVEDSGDSPHCYDPSRHVTDEDPTFGLAFAADAFRLGNVVDRWAYYDAPRDAWHGPSATRIGEVLKTADLVLHLSGVNTLRPWLERIPRRALVDTDPVFTQINHLADSQARAEAATHTSFFSFGENIATGRSTVPNDGFPWQATRQPIVLEAWPVVPGSRDARFTTVMQWNSYAAREYAGQRYGMKSDSFPPYLDLPAMVGRPVEAVVGGNAPRDALMAHGWVTPDPLTTIPDPEGYQRYIHGSAGEFSVAKQGYVIARTGWFSERSAAYMASGRPVVTQETGFTDWLKAEGGVLAFRTVEEAADAIRQVTSDYERHSKAARAAAEQYFDASVVLESLIERAMV